MAARRLARVLQNQYKRAQDEKDYPNLIPFASESNLKEWYFLVVNLPAPFADGEYIFKLTAPDEFPHKPPGFSFCTQNGVYEPGGPICISIGEFHSDDAAGKTGAYGWRPALGMFGFAREVVNGMIDPDYLGGGIRVQNETDDLKAQYAAASSKTNARDHAELMEAFLEFEETHPEHQAVRLRRMWRAAAKAAELDYTTIGDSAEVEALFAAAFGEELWPKLETSLGYLASTPSEKIFAQIADRLVEALTERELAVRRVLVLALHARICAAVWAENGLASEAEWGQRFRDGFAEFLDTLPSVCGGASKETVPSAMEKLADAPRQLAELHADLADFLRTEDIDKKALRGRAFCARVRVLNLAAQVAKPPSPPAGSLAPPPSPPPETMDEFIDDLFDEA